MNTFNSHNMSISAMAPIVSYNNDNNISSSNSSFLMVQSNPETPSIVYGKASSPLNDNNDDDEHHHPGDKRRTDHLNLRSSSNLEQLAATVDQKLATTPRLVIVCPGCEPDWNSPEVLHLFDALSQLPQLQEIKLNCLGLLDVAFPVRLVTRLLRSTSLQGLDLDDVALTGTAEEMAILCEVIRLHVPLEEFRLFGCLADDTVDLQLMDPLLAALSTLKRVEIDAVDDGLLGTIQASTLGTMAHSTTLQNFHLNGFALDNDCLSSLAEALATNTVLEDLSFDLYSGSPGSGAYSLCEALRRNQCLQILHISISHAWNQESFLVAMAHALTTHCTLKNLIVGTISVISDKSAQAFAEMMKYNTVLDLLQLSRYKGDWKSIIHYYSKLNSQRRGYFLQHFEELPRKEWIVALANTGEDLDGLFYFLQLNPLLCSSKEQQ